MYMYSMNVQYIYIATYSMCWHLCVCKQSVSDHHKVHELAWQSSVLLCNLATVFPLVPSPPWLRAPAVRLAGAEGQVLWVRERHFNNISAIRTLHHSHSSVPPQLRGVNSRSQMSRRACLIHHSFRSMLPYFLLTFPQSFWLTQSCCILAEIMPH